MGQLTSSLKKKEDKVEDCSAQPVIGTTKRHFAQNSSVPSTLSRYAEVLKSRGIKVIPDSFLVHEAQSSQYMDEDGDVANEFYMEKCDGKIRKLYKVVDNLRPKGKERYSIPRLNPDLSIVIWQVENEQ